MRLSQQPQSFGQVISDGFASFGPLFFKILPIVIMMFVAAIITGAVGFAVVMFIHGAIGFILGALFFIGIYLLIAYFYTAQLIRTYGVLSGDEQITQETWSLAKHGFIRMIGALIMITIILSAVGILFQLATVWLFMQSTILGIILGVIGWLVFVFLIIKFAMVFPLIAVRKMGVFMGISRSFELIKCNWWRTFGTFFIVVGLPHIGFFALLLFMQMSLVPGILFYLLSAIIFIAQYLVVLVLMLGATIVLMNDLELRKAPKLVVPTPVI